jgi:hypothetical protein
MRQLVVALIAVIGVASSALAVDLNIDLTTPILTAEGKQKQECLLVDKAAPDGCEQKRDLTFGIVAMEALGALDPELRGDEKAKAGALAIKIASAKQMALTLEEATLIKKQVNKFYDPVTVARVNAMLDPGAK